MQACRLYIGNDSGISHLAAALGLPVIALFGPSSAVRWAPRGEKVTLLQAPDGAISSLSLDQVWDAVVAAT
jgi:heptosyltransferase-2